MSQQQDLRSSWSHEYKGDAGKVLSLLFSPLRLPPQKPAGLGTHAWEVYGWLSRAARETFPYRRNLKKPQGGSTGFPGCVTHLLARWSQQVTFRPLKEAQGSAGSSSSKASSLPGLGGWTQPQLRSKPGFRGPHSFSCSSYLEAATVAALLCVTAPPKPGQYSVPTGDWTLSLEGFHWTQSSWT